MKTYYFVISQGLRGCYVSDSCYIVAVKTRRELKRYLESEAYDIRDAGFVGCSREAVAALAAECWRNKGKATLDNVAPYRSHGTSRPEDYPYGLFCSASTKADYREYTEVGR